MALTQGPGQTTSDRPPRIRPDQTASTTLLRTEALSFGTFRCPPDDPRWREENCIGPGHHVVFPQRAVVIDQSGHGPSVANPNHVVFYDAGQTYRRALLSPDGDLCRFVVLAPDLASDLLDATFGTDRGHFPVAGGPVTAEVAMRIHLLGGWLERGQIDHDDAEDGLLDIVQRVLEGAVPPRRREAARRSSTAAARRMLAEDAKAYLSVRFAERGSIRAIAHALGASPFHLSRVFRAETGFTLQTYRDGLRLRCALERLTQGERDLARLAQDVGYASHSHLDVRFRTAFGRSPSTVRAA